MVGCDDGRNEAHLRLRPALPPGYSRCSLPIHRPHALTPDSGAATKTEAVAEFARLFEPGNVVAAAYAAERNLG